MAMDLKFLIGATDETGAATSSAGKNISSLNKSATESGSVFDRVFSGGGSGVSGFMGKLSSLSAQFIAVKFAAEMVGGAIVAMVQPGIEAIEDFTMKVVKMAALITSFKGGSNIAQTYQEAKEYASALQETLEVVDAKTIANAQDLGLITEEMIKQRVVLDVNSKSQIDGFTNMANAVAVVAQGAGSKEIQIRQEIRSLMMGEVNSQSVLSSQINSMVGGGLKQKVALWKEEGTLIENIGKALQGYAAAQGDISATWGAVKSTTSSILNMILRGGFQDVFKSLVGFMDDLNNGAKLHAEYLGNKIQQVWLVIGGIMESVGAIFRTFAGPIGVVWELTKMILEGWGLLLYAVLPPLLDRVASFGTALWEDVKMLGSLVAMLWQGLSFDFSGAAASFENAKGSFLAGGKATGAAFADGLGAEITSRSQKFLDLDLLKGKTKSSVTTPDLGKAPVTEDERKAIGGAATALAKYSDAIKDVGKSRLSLASAQFNDDLKRQAELLTENGRVFGNIRGPVDSYLALITDVEKQQTKLENSVGSALDKLQGQRGGKDEKGKLQDDLEKAQKKHELALLTITKSAADERLKVWTSYYENLKGVIEKKEKEIEALHEKMMASRTKIADAIEANSKTLQGPGRDLDPYEARLKAKDDILDAITKAAKGGDLDANIKALDNLIAKAQELSTAVNMDGQDIISQVDAVNQGNELLRMIGEAQEKLHQDAISKAEKDVSVLKGELKSALDNVKEIRTAIEELDDRIARMQTSISLVADDKVSPVLDRIKQQIDALKNSSITIGDSYTPTYPGGSVTMNDTPYIQEGESSGGTGYVSKTGIYQLHQGETVNKRLDVAKTQTPTTIDVGGIQVILPNVTRVTEEDAEQIARMIFPKIKRYAAMTV